MKTIAILVLAIFIFGCAPPPRAGTAADRSRALGATSRMNVVAGADGDWRCPPGDNVTLKNNIGPNGYDYSGNGGFKVCVSRSSVSNFRVTGTTTAQVLCIYPMHADSASLRLVEDPKCFSVTGQPIVTDGAFKAKDINYMFIVDQNYTNATTSCLVYDPSRGSTPCPSHSEGFVQ